MSGLVPITDQQVIHAVIKATKQRAKGNTDTGWPDDVLIEETGFGRDFCIQAIMNAWRRGFLIAGGRCRTLLRHARPSLKGIMLIEDDHR